MKNILFRYASILAIAAVSFLGACTEHTINPDPDVNGEGFVHVKNGQLVDEHNQPLKLKTVNIGGWLLWEGWIWGGGFASEKEIFNSIKSRTSESFANAFRDSVYNNFITEADLLRMKACGFNSICVNFNHRLLDNDVPLGNIAEANFKPLDKIIDLCERHNMYVILEMHALPGGQSSYFVADPDNTQVWYSDDSKVQTVKLWKTIAARYANKKIIAGYDLIGEPAPLYAQQLLDLYAQIIKGIRSVDKTHMLILQGMDFTKNVSFFDKVLDRNQIFSFHYYPWLIPQDQWGAELDKFDAFSRKVGVPVWIGEWGEFNNTDLDKLLGLIRSPKYNFCGDAFWTWKKVVTSQTAALNTISVSDDWKRLVQNQDKQSNQTYEQIANGFLQNSRIQNTVLDNTLQNTLLSH